MRLVPALMIVLTLFSVAPALAGELEDGVAAYEAGDYPAALGLLVPLAEQGDALAQTFLGLMHDLGDGVPLDDAQAVHWYRLAADQGVADAQYLLGTMYDGAEGVPEDNAEAIRWFRLAAEQGHETAILLIESYEKFKIEGEAIAYDTAFSEVSAVDAEWLVDLLLANPDVRTMQLTSQGGDIYAAYAMADVIIDFGLDTYVVGECLSACTMLFLAGDGRAIQRGSRLGFHQSRWDAQNMREFYGGLRASRGWKDEFDFSAWVYLDAVNDVLVAMRFMLERGVDPGFAIRTLDANPDDMWYPWRTELEEAGVLRE